MLDQMVEPTSETLREDVAFLRANILLALGRPDEAGQTLRPLEGSKYLQGFSDFNLAIALLRSGQTADAVRRLDRAGRVDAEDRDRRAIRDKANLVLGSLLSEAERHDVAQRAFDRVRLDGPFSNDALLRAGWSEVSRSRFERAVVPWSILAERDPTDRAVQEALLALPFAYSKLDVHGRAAVLYQSAATRFGEQIQKLEASIESIDRGHFLRALEREEVRRDADWVIRMRSLPDAPETHYLVSLVASHDFQTALQNYLDLLDMNRKLADGRRSLDAFDELIELRRRYYEPRFPRIDERFRKVDAQMRVRLEQARNARERLSKMLTSPAPAMLARPEEHQDLVRLVALESALERTQTSPEQADEIRTRIRRIRGTITWRLETEYHERLTAIHEALRALDLDIESLTAKYDSYVRMRQAASHSYAGQARPISDLRQRVARAVTRIDELKAQQGRELERVARMTLQARRERLLAYQNKARFAFADSYDRASMPAAPR